MNLSSDYRRRIVMASEGSAIGAVGTNGSEMQGEIVRAQIDGLFNALIRIDGAETAAGYAFTMGDRVAAGLRAPTDFRLPKPVLVQPAPPPPDSLPAPADAKSDRIAWWCSYLLGCLHGAIAVSVLTWIIGGFIAGFVR